MFGLRKKSKSRPRILFVQKPPGGGSATGLYDLVAGINKSLFEPVILFYEHNYYSDRFKELGVEVLHLNKSGNTTPATGMKRNILTGTGLSSLNVYRSTKKIYRILFNELPVAWRISRIIKAKDIDIIHHNNDLSLNRPSVIAAAIARKPQISHVRWLTDYSSDKIAYFLDRNTSRFVDFFIYMSKAIEKTYVPLGIAAERGEVINDPFDLKIYVEAMSFSEQIRNEFGVRDKDNLISNVGRIMPWKGQDYFLESLVEVVNAFPNTKALVVGAPEPGQGSKDFYQELKKKAKELGIYHNVIFTGFRKDIPAIMAASDIVVHSASEPEPFGRVIVEAMASGRPVIATAAGGAAEIFEDQKTGILVQPKDATSMSKAIIQLLGDKDFARKMGNLAQVDVKNRFTVEQHISAVQNIYSRILDKER
jgi:glycosyltransferase involved in cell wall biosynthesis